jgi:hypothetical protein
MTIINYFSSWQSLSFLWRAVDTTENVNCSRKMLFVAKMLIICFCCVLSRSVKCDRKMRFQIFSCRNIFVNSFSWSCSIISSSMFRLCDSNFFEMTNVLRKRFIKFNESDSSILIRAIFRQIWWIASHQIWWVEFYQTWRIIFHQIWRMIFHQIWRMIFY